MYPSNFRKNIRLLVCTPAHLRLFRRENFLGFATEFKNDVPSASKLYF